jgi:hypothetical protein
MNHETPKFFMPVSLPLDAFHIHVNACDHNPLQNLEAIDMPLLRSSFHLGLGATDMSRLIQRWDLHPGEMKQPKANLGLSEETLI